MRASKPKGIFVPHSKTHKAKLIAIVALEAEHQYLAQEGSRGSRPWVYLDDLEQPAWALKACSVLGVEPEQWRSAVQDWLEPGQSVKQLLVSVVQRNLEAPDRSE